MEIIVKFYGNNTCAHCGESIDHYDTVVVRDNEIYHEECLPENLKEIDN